jgi:hypothetical protein
MEPLPGNGETSFFLPIAHPSGFVIVISVGFSSDRMRWIGQLHNCYGPYENSITFVP